MTFVIMTMAMRHYGCGYASLLFFSAWVVAQHFGELTCISLHVGIFNLVLNTSVCACSYVLEHTVLSARHFLLTILQVLHLICWLNEICFLDTSLGAIMFLTGFGTWQTVSIRTIDEEEEALLREEEARKEIDDARQATGGGSQSRVRSFISATLSKQHQPALLSLFMLL